MKLRKLRNISCIKRVKHRILNSMQGNNHATEGSISISAVFSLGIILIILSGLLFLLSSVRNYAVRLKNKDAVRAEAINLLYDIQDRMPVLKEDDADSPFSDGVRMLESTYAAYDLQIKDVSSGINPRFLDAAFLKNEAINNLILSDPENNLVEYGWAHKRMISEEMKSRVQASFAVRNNEALFPLINEFPLTNVYYLSEECLTAFLQYYKIKDAEKKAFIIKENTRIQSKIDFEPILDVEMNHGIFDLIGNKTSFWKVTFFYESCMVEAVFCAVPDKKEPQKIDHYKLVERKIRL